MTDRGFDPSRFLGQLNELDDLSIEPVVPTIEDIFIKWMKR